MTKSQITHKQATTLAAFIHELRGDWDAPGILDQLGKARQMAPAADLAVAAIRAAKDGKNRTPAVIGMEGPHWRGSDTPPRYEQPTKAETCSTCYQSQDVCRSRWATDHPFIPLTQATAGRSLAPDDARAELATTKAASCRHSINRERAKCADCDRAETTTKETSK